MFDEKQIVIKKYYKYAWSFFSTMRTVFVKIQGLQKYQKNNNTGFYTA